jgi:hypothetical protein
MCRTSRLLHVIRKKPVVAHRIYIVFIKYLLVFFHHFFIMCMLALKLETFMQSLIQASSFSTPRNFAKLENNCSLTSLCENASG